MAPGPSGGHTDTPPPTPTKSPSAAVGAPRATRGHHVPPLAFPGPSKWILLRLPGPPLSPVPGVPPPPPKDLQIPLRTFFGVSPSKPPNGSWALLWDPPSYPLNTPTCLQIPFRTLFGTPRTHLVPPPPPDPLGPLECSFTATPNRSPQEPFIPLRPGSGNEPPPDNGLFWGVGGGLQMVLWRWGPSCGCHALRGCQRRRCGVWWMLTPKGALRCAPTHCASVPTRGTRCRWGGDDGTWGFVGGAPEGSCGVLGGGGESGAP